MFIDAIPAIIIPGTVPWPLAEVSQMHPIHFAITGVISLAFGLVTPPYGLCLLVACSNGGIKVHQALRDEEERSGCSPNWTGAWWWEGYRPLYRAHRVVSVIFWQEGAADPKR